MCSMINSIFTDISFSKNTVSKEEYSYSTNIPHYNLIEGTDTEWCLLNNFYNGIEWEGALNIHNMDKKKLEQNVDSL